MASDRGKDKLTFVAMPVPENACPDERIDKLALGRADGGRSEAAQGVYLRDGRLVHVLFGPSVLGDLR